MFYDVQPIKNTVSWQCFVWNAMDNWELAENHNKFFKLLLANQRAVLKYCGNGGVALNLYKIESLNFICSRSKYSGDFLKEENDSYQPQKTGRFEIEL